jgi:hypothetical protein
MNWKRKVLTAKGHIFVKLIINYTVYCTVHKDDRKEKLIMNHEIWYVHKCVKAKQAANKTYHSSLDGRFLPPKSVINTHIPQFSSI